ncbi:glycosyltransferase family 1 protein [Ornithinimicrobium panacihumi]|uniref:glycosyltransferase family 1 protein n=1 Tax=Ornithinimicrobium panacihumi TaxID=2008449 RepID=UPI003F8C2D8A
MSFSPLRSDARVLRQITLFSPRYAVTTLGYGPSPEGVVAHLRIADEVVNWHKDRRLLATRRYETAYRTSPVVVAARDLLEEHRGEFDVVLADDIDTVPLALDLGAPGGVHADLHEYHPRQNEDSPRWRLFVAPYYRWLVRTYGTRADSVSTVAEGIAREYRHRFGIRAVVVPNAAPYVEREPTPVGSTLRLVHSGVARRDRHLHLMLDAVELMERPVSLDLYLTANDPAYLAELRERATGMDGVTVHDPVAPHELNGVLAEADLGVFVLPPDNFNYLWSLPNKVFDFVQARLGLVVGPSPEMAALVRRHGLGVVTDDFSAAGLAQALDRLSTEEIATFKAASHRAAHELSAERQVHGWTRAIDTLTARLNG